MYFYVGFVEEYLYLVGRNEFIIYLNFGVYNYVMRDSFGLQDLTLQTSRIGALHGREETMWKKKTERGLVSYLETMSCRGPLGWAFLGPGA